MYRWRGERDGKDWGEQRKDWEMKVRNKTESLLGRRDIRQTEQQGQTETDRTRTKVYAQKHLRGENTKKLSEVEFCAQPMCWV